MGFDISSDETVRKDAFLFGEAQSRIIVSISNDKEEQFIETLANSVVEFTFLGEVVDDNAVVDGESFGSIKELAEIYESVIPKMMGE